MVKNRSVKIKLNTLMLSSALAVASVVPWMFGSPAASNADAELCQNEIPGIAQEHKATQSGKPSHSRAHYLAASRVSTSTDGVFWNSLTKTWLSEEQIYLLSLAYEVGLQDDDKQHAELMQGVLLQETIAGQLGRIGHLSAPVGKRSYGIMQVKVSAARDVLRKYQDEFSRFRSDEELIIGLMTDDELNMRIASKFMLMLSERAKSVDQALVAYNIGFRASYRVKDHDQFKYVVKVRRHLSSVVRPFNERFVASHVQVAMN